MECKEKLFPNPQYTAELIKKNYGHAGKRFVEIIKQLGAEKIREIQAKFQKEIYRDNVMQKQSISLSIIMTADKIATDYLFEDEQYINLDDAREVLASQADVSEHERCYQYLIDKISMNGSRFDDTASVEQWGVIRDDYALMYPQAVKDLCEHNGFSYKAFMNWADRNGVLQTDGERQTKVRKIAGKAVRCVCLLLAEREVKDKDGFESADIYEEKELPFK